MHTTVADPHVSGAPSTLARVLVVCTANQCRSPMAERLLQRAVERRGAVVRVSSAGLLAGGRPAEAKAVRALDRLGLDLTSHISRRLTPELLQDSDLVVTMERRHVQAAVELLSGCWPRTFTLSDLLERGAQRPPRQPQEDVAAWVGRLHDGRRPADVLLGGVQGDVADPVGRGPAAFRRTAQDLEAATAALAALMFPDRAPMTTDMDERRPAHRRWPMTRRR